MSEDTTNNHAAFVWPVAKLLRGDYRQSDYQKVYEGLQGDGG